MLTNYLAGCAHLTITISQIERDIGRKSSFFHTTLHSTPPLGGFPSEYRHPVWCGKTRMVWLATRRWKNFEDMFIRFDMIHERDRQTDRQTDTQTNTAWRHRWRLCIASRGKTVPIVATRNLSSTCMDWLRWENIGHTWSALMVNASTNKHLLSELAVKFDEDDGATIWSSWRDRRRYVCHTGRHLRVLHGAWITTISCITSCKYEYDMLTPMCCTN